MIQKKLKTANGRLAVKIPDKLDELTLEQLMDLQEKPDIDDLEAISILSGISLTALRNVNDINDFEVFKEGILALSDEIKDLYNAEVLPDKITFFEGKNSVSIKVFNNLSIEPAGAFMAAREVITEEIKEHIKKYGDKDWVNNFNPSLKACCQVLAHYFFCKVTRKKYDEFEAEEFCTEIKKLWVLEALPIARHFFISYPNLSKPKTSYFQRLLLLWRKRREYRPFINLNISTL